MLSLIKDHKNLMEIYKSEPDKDIALGMALFEGWKFKDIELSWMKGVEMQANNMFLDVLEDYIESGKTVEQFINDMRK